MPEIIFSHPNPSLQPPLTVHTKPDQVTWAYGLNVARYPTYGGEVVQILSVYFDDMTIAGTVSSYAQLERIYTWFLTYMQVATQGRDNPSYDQRPVTFFYPERNWTFQIWPKSLPGFKYGKSVVAPTWSVQAAVKEPDAAFADQIKFFSARSASAEKEFALFGKATADFGFTSDLQNNPWASYDADPSIKSTKLDSKGKKLQSNEMDAVNKAVTSELNKNADTFSSFVQAYASGSLNKLPQFPDVSKPASTPAGGKNSTTTTKKTGKVNKK